MNTRKVQDFVVKGKEVFVGLEDSKKTWKIAVRCEKMLVHQTSMEAKYPVLIKYLRNKFPECAIHLIYEAGFKGFNLFDRLTEDGIDCVVIPPHLVTEPKVKKVKTDKRDANRLALILENHDFKDRLPCPGQGKKRRPPDKPHPHRDTERHHPYPEQNPQASRLQRHRRSFPRQMGQRGV